MLKHVTKTLRVNLFYLRETCLSKILRALTVPATKGLPETKALKSTEITAHIKTDEQLSRRNSLESALLHKTQNFFKTLRLPKFVLDTWFGVTERMDSQANRNVCKDLTKGVKVVDNKEIHRLGARLREIGDEIDGRINRDRERGQNQLPLKDFISLFVAATAIGLLCYKIRKVSLIIFTNFYYKKYD